MVNIHRETLDFFRWLAVRLNPINTMASRYITWTVPQLKKELIQRDASTHGRKTDLIERLESYDRNKNFLPPPVLLPEPLDVNWPSTGFQQLKPDHQGLLPVVTRDQTEAYFLHRLAGDNDSARNIKAIKNGELLYDSKRILACSVLIKNEIFFTGIVSAAMKNKVTYNYKLRLEKQSGDILSSHCECPAGKGPNGTCKHLAAVMVMLEKFIGLGELTGIEKTCTESLMMFNKPKTSHKGSPVKVENLSRKRKSENILDDPRPEKRKNMEGFEDRVLNILVNYTAKSSANIAYRYLFKRADLKTAVHDHDYLSLPFTEYWVDEAIKVNDLEIKKIEVATRGQTANKKWFGERTWRLTASSFGQITHMTEKRNKEKLCETIFSSKQINSEATLHGKNYERKAIKCFESKYKQKVNGCGFFIYRPKPFLGASPDGVIDDMHIVEVKCPYLGRNVNIESKCLKHFRYLEEINGVIQLKKSSNYYDQIQGQLLITGRQFCYFVVYTFKSLFVEKIEFDQDYCKFCLVPKLDLFYKKWYRPFVASKLYAKFSGNSCIAKY